MGALPFQGTGQNAVASGQGPVASEQGADAASKGGHRFVREQAIPPQAIRYRPCAQCGKLMNRTNYGRISGVVLDTCKQRGLWFDQDELRRVLMFIEGGGLERSRDCQIQALEDKQRWAAIGATAPVGWGETESPAGPGLQDLVKAVESLIGWIRR